MSDFEFTLTGKFRWSLPEEKFGLDPERIQMEQAERAYRAAYPDYHVVFQASKLKLSAKEPKQIRLTFLGEVSGIISAENRAAAKRAVFAMFDCSPEVLKCGPATKREPTELTVESAEILLESATDFIDTGSDVRPMGNNAPQKSHQGGKESSGDFQLKGDFKLRAESDQSD